MTMQTLADLAAFIAARGIEIEQTRVRWLPSCAFCDSPLQRDDTYEVMADDLVVLCGACAARLAVLARNRLCD
jgi:hypothetical protein